MEVVQTKRDPDRTEQACTAAANKWNEEGIALLISRLHERDDLVRKSAAEALGKRGDKRAIEPLRTLLLQMRRGGADFMTDTPLPAPLPGKRFLREDYTEHIVGYKAVVKAISEIERKNNLTHVEVGASSKSKAEYRGISRCERTQVEVTFDYDPIQQIIKNFVAFHSCIGSPPGISWTINQDVAVQPNGQFSYEDKYGNFAKGTISKNSKASGELGSYSAVDVLTCKDGNQYRLCSQWRAAPAFPQ
jgi:hypothetical protein